MNPIPESELSAIEARCNAATQGPWNVSTVATSIGCCHRIGPLYRRGQETWICVYDDGDYPSNPNPHLLASATLIAHARTDLPKLLAAYREAMKDVRRMEWLEGRPVYVPTVTRAIIDEYMQGVPYHAAMAGKEKA